MYLRPNLIEQYKYAGEKLLFILDSLNIKFTCDTWGLTCTDIMQGVVFGVKVTGDETPAELTRFDYDEHFGEILHMEFNPKNPH